ncbi:MAG: hypothetical protein ABUT20_03945 [Bacteroidota bacterium]
MEILFTKTGKEEHVFSCKRKDGSTTWKHVGEFFMLHDLGHYAVETILHLKNGFFGMVASGTDISDFDLPKEQRAFQLTDEALFAEQLVNMVVIDFTQGRMENLIEIFTSIYDLDNGSILMRNLTEEKLEKIRTAYNELLTQWEAIPLSGVLKLSFEE